MRSSARVVRFGSFEADLDAGELRKRGLKIHLPGQVFQVLAMLLERPGDLVTRAELRDRIWSDDTFVGFDHSLNKAVNRLRQAFSDSATNPRFIETVARRGYRLIVPVSAPSVDRQRIGSGMRVRLAVLPFENHSSDPDQEFFSDGLTEEMISELGRLSPGRLGVIARTSAMHYRGTSKRIDEIGNDLGVEYILEGSVRRAGTHVRITAQLVQVSDQTHLWAESYSRELADVLLVQHEVAQRVASSLAFELLPAERSRDRVVPPDAYEAYLRGRYCWNRGTDVDAWTAIQWFEKALERNPDYAAAHAAISECYGRLAWFAALPPGEAHDKAKGAALRALQIDSELAEGHFALALVHFWFDWDWSGAEQSFRRAIAVHPGYASAHNLFAAFLNAMCRFDEAAREQRIAEQLDPLSLIIAMNAADPHYFSRHYDLAIETLRRVLAREPHFFSAHFNLGRAYALSGRQTEAVSAFQMAASLSGVKLAHAGLAYGYAVNGVRDQAVTILQELDQLAETRYVPAPQLALIPLGLGNHEEAIRRLNQGFEQRSPWMIYVRADPVWDPLRSLPAFQDLIAKLNFPSLRPVTVSAAYPGS